RSGEGVGEGWVGMAVAIGMGSASGSGDDAEGAEAAEDAGGDSLGTGVAAGRGLAVGVAAARGAGGGAVELAGSLTTRRPMDARATPTRMTATVAAIAMIGTRRRSRRRRPCMRVRGVISPPRQGAQG